MYLKNKWVRKSDADAWWADLRAKSLRGVFVSSLVLYVVRGEKPPLAEAGHLKEVGTRSAALLYSADSEEAAVWPAA